MPNFSSYSNLGVMAFIKESTAAVAIKPTSYWRYISDTFTPSYNIQEVNEISGSAERRIRAIQGNIEMSGEVEFFCDEKIVGHFLRALLGAPSTQNVVASTSYRHTFTLQDTDKTYTFDIQPADAPWVHRFFGVHVSQIAFTREDNAIKVTATMMPTKAFTVAKVTVAVNSGTTLTIDQTEGLTTSDTILVLAKEDGYTTVKELTIAALPSSTVLTTSTIDVQLDVGDLVVIKRPSVTDSDYTQCLPFQFMNGTTISQGADIDNTASFTIEDLQVTIMRELEARYGSGGNEANRFPYAILGKGFSAEGQITRYYDSETFISRLRGNTEFAIRYFMQARVAISANAAQAASSVWGASNGFKVAATTAGRAGNDYNVTIVMNTVDTLAVTLSGANSTNILIQLASTTAANNTGTFMAAAVDALAGVTGTVEGTGATTFGAADVAPNVNLGDKSTGVNVIGADASEKPYLQIDYAAGRLDPFFVGNKEDDIINEEVPFKGFVDSDCDDDQKKNFNVKIRLFNEIASY